MEGKMKKLKNAIGVVAIIVITAVLSYGGWQIARKWNYNLSYKRMVKQTVIEMVKESALK